MVIVIIITISCSSSSSNANEVLSASGKLKSKFGHYLEEAKMVNKEGEVIVFLFKDCSGTN